MCASVRALKLAEAAGVYGTDGVVESATASVVTKLAEPHQMHAGEIWLAVLIIYRLRPSHCFIDVFIGF